MEPSQTPFDEKAALEELERLRDAIQAARRARMAKSDEFDEFVNGFKTPPPLAPETPLVSAAEDASGASEDAFGVSEDAPHVESPAAPMPAMELATAPVPAIELPTPAPVPELLTLTPTPEPSTVTMLPERRPAGPPRRYPGIRIIAIAGIAALALIAALAYSSRGPSTRVVEAPASTVQPSPPPVEAPPVSTPPPPAPAPVANVNVELRTLQPVWMRVTVDGQKQREGTVPAGEQLQLHADHAIIVRAGNGGDVMVKTANGETPLGVAGQPVTFTFTKAGGKL